MSNINDYLNNLRNYKKRPGGFEQFPWNPKSPSKEAFYRQVDEEQMLYEQELREAREQELEESADAGVGGDSDAKSQFSNVLLKYVVEGEDASNLTDVQIEVMKDEVRQKAADELTGGDTSLITVEISDGSIAFDISVLLPGLLSQNTALVAALAELAKQVEQQILTVAKEVAGVENLTIVSGTVETKDTLNPEPTELPPAEPTDTDGDGVPDDQDDFDNDPTETTDSDGDGVGDNADAFDNDPTETTDSDGDGVGDNADFDPNDPNIQVEPVEPAASDFIEIRLGPDFPGGYERLPIRSSAGNPYTVHWNVDPATYQSVGDTSEGTNRFPGHTLPPGEQTIMIYGNVEWLGCTNDESGSQLFLMNADGVPIWKFCDHVRIKGMSCLKNLERAFVRLGFDGRTHDGQPRTCTFDFTQADFSNVESYRWMFLHAIFDEVNMDNLIDTSAPHLETNNTWVEVSYMFQYSGVKRVSIKNANVPRTGGISGMFQKCQQVEEIYMSGWTNTHNFVSTASAFHECLKCHTLDLSGMDFSTVTNANWMFRNLETATEVIGLAGTCWAGIANYSSATHWLSYAFAFDQDLSTTVFPQLKDYDLPSYFLDNSGIFTQPAKHPKYYPNTCDTAGS